MLPIAWRRALERMIRGDMAWEVNIEHADRTTFAKTYDQTTLLSAVGAALHDYSMRTNRNLNEIARLEVRRVQGARS